MDIVHFSLPFHWPGGAGRSTENGDRRSDSAITPMAMIRFLASIEIIKLVGAPYSIGYDMTLSMQTL